MTLLVDGSNRDAHFAGLLVSSLTLGGQEVPRDLYSLAMKVGFTYEWLGLFDVINFQVASCALRIGIVAYPVGKLECVLYML